MGDTDHDVALLLLAEEIDVLLSRLCRIEIGDTLAVAVKHKSLQGWGKGKDADLHTLTLKDDIGFHQVFQHRSLTVVVRTDDGEVGHLKEFGHIIHTEVELMVTDGDSIIAHLVHQPHLYLTLEERVVT